MVRSRLLRGIPLAAVLLCVHVATQAAPPPLEAFFAGAQIRSVSISPDGQALAMIVTADGKQFVAVKDRAQRRRRPHPILAPNGKDGFEPRWCRWANDERIVCSFIGRERDKYQGKVFPVTRLVSVNRDGSQAEATVAESVCTPSGQLNDRIIDWTPEDPTRCPDRKVQPAHGAAGSASSTSTTARSSSYESPYEHIGGFGSDGHGNVRLGWGSYDLKNYFYARLEGEKKWRELARIQGAVRRTKPTCRSR